MKIFYTNKAAAQLENLPHLVQKRIIKKMRFYANQKNPLKFAKPLVDYREGEFRFRVGKYRLIFDVKNNAIYILKIAKRDKIYDWKLTIWLFCAFWYVKLKNISEFTLF